MNTWDSYWSAKQDKASGAYDRIAGLYRRHIIRPRLETALRKEFLPGSRLLHAGCGSGEVDMGLAKVHPVVGRDFDIVGVDLSASAVDLYRKNNPNATAYQADIFKLPESFGPFDGIYNLGVLEHFEEHEILRMLGIFKRLLKPGGKMVFFWPHAQATSVAVLGLASKVMKRAFHPPEPSLCPGPDGTRRLFLQAGLWVDSYRFGPSDGWVQAIVVASMTGPVAP